MRFKQAFGKSTSGRGDAYCLGGGAFDPHDRARCSGSGGEILMEGVLLAIETEQGVQVLVALTADFIEPGLPHQRPVRISCRKRLRRQARSMYERIHHLILRRNGGAYAHLL